MLQLERSCIKSTQLEQELQRTQQQIWQLYLLSSAVLLLSFCLFFFFCLLGHIHFYFRRPILFQVWKWYLTFYLLLILYGCCAWIWKFARRINVSNYFRIIFLSFFFVCVCVCVCVFVCVCVCLGPQNDYMVVA